MRTIEQTLELIPNPSLKRNFVPYHEPRKLRFRPQVTTICTEYSANQGN